MADAGRLTRLHGLDELRGIAAICVVIGHVLSYSALPSGKSYLAVDFFLVLSGYVMARTYEDRMRNGLGTWSFFKLRYRRLWPVVAVGSLLGLAVNLHLSFLEIGLGFLMVPLFTAGLAFPLNPVAWSTALEIVLNTMHPRAFAFVRSRALVLAVIASALATVPYLAPGHGLEGGPSGGQFGFALLRGLISYPIGILLWRHWRDIPPFMVPRSFTVLFMPVAFLASVFATIPLVFLDYLFVIAICPVIIAGGLRTNPKYGAILGAMSFPLYAIHYPLILICIKAGAPPWLGGLIALVLATGFAHFVERRKAPALSVSERV